jgi:hypothetical protein
MMLGETLPLLCRLGEVPQGGEQVDVQIILFVMIALQINCHPCCECCTYIMPYSTALHVSLWLKIASIACGVCDTSG